MKLPVYAALLIGAVFVASSAQAADLILTNEPIAKYGAGWVAPAVSGLNGKLELDLGYLTDPSSLVFRGAASVTAPIGDAFGLQADAAAQNFDGNWSAGAALHAFTRDPGLYLAGLTGAIVRSESTTLMAIGPEAELYLDRISVEAWAGWAKLDHDGATPDEDGVFGMVDVAYYATDDWRVSAGAASILGRESLNVATEYQFNPDWGLSVAGEGRWYDTGALQAMIGVKGYIGAPGKSLIDRHRHDDPRNRALNLVHDGSLMTGGGAPTPLIVPK